MRALGFISDLLESAFGWFLVRVTAGIDESGEGCATRLKPVMSLVDAGRAVDERRESAAGEATGRHVGQGATPNGGTRSGRASGHE